MDANSHESYFDDLRWCSRCQDKQNVAILENPKVTNSVVGCIDTTFELEKKLKNTRGRGYIYINKTIWVQGNAETYYIAEQVTTSE